MPSYLFDNAELSKICFINCVWLCCRGQCATYGSHFFTMCFPGTKLTLSGRSPSAFPLTVILTSLSFHCYSYVCVFPVKMYLFCTIN